MHVVLFRLPYCDSVECKQAEATHSLASCGRSENLGGLTSAEAWKGEIPPKTRIWWSPPAVTGKNYTIHIIDFLKFWWLPAGNLMPVCNLALLIRMFSPVLLFHLLRFIFRDDFGCQILIMIIQVRHPTFLRFQVYLCMTHIGSWNPWIVAQKVFSLANHVVFNPSITRPAVQMKNNSCGSWRSAVFQSHFPPHGLTRRTVFSGKLWCWPSAHRV